MVVGVKWDLLTLKPKLPTFCLPRRPPLPCSCPNILGDKCYHWCEGVISSGKHGRYVPLYKGLRHDVEVVQHFSLRHLLMIQMVSALMFPRSSTMAPPARRDQADIFSGCKPSESLTMYQEVRRVCVRSSLVTLSHLYPALTANRGVLEGATCVRMYTTLERMRHMA